MNIKDAQYIKNPIDNEVNMIKATIDGEKSWVPLDPNNRHYAEILRQVKEEGLTIKDAE
tara:strand:- start:163 stop:339 length:177 start_codon:yes stop_codon:yes gene_type:complete